MSISGMEAVSAASQTPSSAAGDRNTIGKNDFLNLLVAQLKAQDPLNPMDGTDFTAQLAQFSSLEQLSNMNQNMNQMVSSQNTMNEARAVDLIGKTVKAENGSVEVSDGTCSTLTVDLARDSAAAFISIYDAMGNYVTSVTQAGMTAGEHEFQWDGKDGEGNRVPDGRYAFEVTAMDGDGAMIDTHRYISAKVNAVTFREDRAYLVAGGQEIPADSVVQVTGEE